METRAEPTAAGRVATDALARLQARSCSPGRVGDKAPALATVRRDLLAA